eukprot:gene40761-49709_t
MPTGWYEEDDTKNDYITVVNRKAELNPHPLSYAQLQKFGYSDIIEDIMALGGPLAVGNALGIEWREKEPSKCATPLGPQEINMFDLTGGLSLGASLEERLAAAELLRLKELKDQISEVRKKDSLYPHQGSPLSEPDYKDPSRKISQAKKPVVSAVAVDPLSRFTLTSLERIHLVSLLLFSAIAYGRASLDLLEMSSLHSYGLLLVDLSRLISSVLLVSSVVSVALNVKDAAAAQTNPLVWAFRSLFGGPCSVRIFRSLRERRD